MGNEHEMVLTPFKYVEAGERKFTNPARFKNLYFLFKFPLSMVVGLFLSIFLINAPIAHAAQVSRSEVIRAYGEFCLKTNNNWNQSTEHIIASEQFDVKTKTSDNNLRFTEATLKNGDALRVFLVEEKGGFLTCVVEFSTPIETNVELLDLIAIIGGKVGVRDFVETRGTDGVYRVVYPKPDFTTLLVLSRKAAPQLKRIKTSLLEAK